MKWFKHDSSASVDVKLERLMIKYGMEGYGLYWFCLEMIARTVEKHNLTFELEHDAEVIAHRVGMNYKKVQDIMTYMVEIGLFENDRGVITCLKMATRTDEYTQKLLKNLVSVPTLSRQTPDTTGTKSDLIEEIEEIDKKPKRPKSKKSIPKDFGISDGVKRWAKEKGFNNLETHLENFVMQATARGYQYADWDAAFKNAIRNDWAKIGTTEDQFAGVI